MQTFIAPVDGNYKLEIWGAASGKYLYQHVLVNFYGRGGYSYGNYVMSKNQKVYVSVGGKGEDGKYQSRNRGGWNGGGDGEWDHNDDESCAGGGGCTSIQKSLISDGQLKHYESVKNTEVLIVAGGAGGLNYYTNDIVNSGYGGGETGCMLLVNSYENKQATQISGYAFGQGQSAPTKDISGAGGGWYGGYTIIDIDIPKNGWAMAGGGSGHIGTMLTNGATIAGDQTFPSPSGGTETGHSGDGYCIISWISPSL